MKSAGRLRIIGGDWRGRRLDVADGPGLRPTPDRVRETLFNWLQWDVAGARCLDPFAGTGALGFEAASRGAASVAMFELNPAAARVIDNNIRTLEAGSRITLRQGDAFSLMPALSKPFDLILLDPPYRLGLLARAINVIADAGLVANNGVVYFEYAGDEAAPDLPAGWELERRKQAGQVVYGFCRCCSAV